MSLIFHSWYSLIPAPWSQVLLMLIAVICGAIIGAERERREKPAGLRTMILICLGSTAFAMVSYAYVSNTGDSGRVAAQIVTGIGFLGAGVIMRDRGTITGMTTAATIWVSAAVGLTVGVGFAGAGIGLSILVRAVLGGIRLVEERGLGKISRVHAKVVFSSDHGKARVRLTHLLSTCSVSKKSMHWLPGESGHDSVLELELQLHEHRLYDVLDQIARDESVKSMDVEEK